MIGIAWRLWRLKWLFVAILALLLFAGAWLHWRALGAELALARSEALQLGEANRRNLATIAALREERRLVDRLAARRLAETRAGAAAFHRLVKKVTAHDPANDCPLSPAVDVVLDGLSELADRDNPHRAAHPPDLAP